MNTLPQTDRTLLIRTDFSDTAAWLAVRAAIATPNEDGFLAVVQVVDDLHYRDLTTGQVVALVPARGHLVVIADATTLAAPDMQLLAVMPHEEDDEDEDASERDYDELRVTAAELWSIEANISTGNMGWEEFVDAADENGVFRGF